MCGLHKLPWHQNFRKYVKVTEYFFGILCKAQVHKTIFIFFFPNFLILRMYTDQFKKVDFSCFSSKTYKFEIGWKFNSLPPGIIMKSTSYQREIVLTKQYVVCKRLETRSKSNPNYVFGA